jgi:hypothetical protein
MLAQRDLPCLTLIYTPAGNPAAEALVSSMLSGNDPPLPPEQVLSLRDPAEVDLYLLDHPQTVLAALHLTFPNASDAPGGRQQQAPSYILQTNASSQFFKGSFQDPTTYIQLPMQAALERAFAEQQLQSLSSSSTAQIQIKDFPHPSLTTESVAGRVSPVFILASLMFNLVVLLTAVVRAGREPGKMVWR